MWLQLDGEAGDAQDWKDLLADAGFVPAERPTGLHRPASWRYSRPATGCTVTLAEVRPVRGEPRDLAIYKPGPGQSLEDAPAFFRGVSTAHLEDGQAERPPSLRELRSGTRRPATGPDDGIAADDTDPAAHHPGRIQRRSSDAR